MLGGAPFKAYAGGFAYIISDPVSNTISIVQIRRPRLWI